MTPEIIDPVIRLLNLLDHPHDIPVLAPLVEREILYRLLGSEQGAMLRRIALADSSLSRISRAIAWIRSHYTEPLRIDAIARLANMSPSAFHAHFKAATAMTPLQYQKTIRLQQARRLLLLQQSDAAGIGYSVGYASASQFSREYSRMFGFPPGRDLSRLRA